MSHSVRFQRLISQSEPEQASTHWPFFFIKFLNRNHYHVKCRFCFFPNIFCVKSFSVTKCFLKIFVGHLKSASILTKVRLPTFRSPQTPRKRDHTGSCCYCCSIFCVKSSITLFKYILFFLVLTFKYILVRKRSFGCLCLFKFIEKKTCFCL